MTGRQATDQVVGWLEYRQQDGKGLIGVWLMEGRDVGNRLESMAARRG